MFIPLLLFITDAFILLASFQYQAPNDEFFVSDKEKYREMYCNTDDHIVLQFCFILVILLINTVLAVKARHLPANFKETRVIILANILSVVIAGNILWLSYYEKSYYWKSIFMFYAVYLLTSINFVILYIYKVYIILFLPEKNTKKYFSSCIRKKIQKQTEEVQMTSR